MKSFQHLASINEELERLSAKSHRRHKELRRLNQAKRSANEVVIALACEVQALRDQHAAALLELGQAQSALGVANAYARELELQLEHRSLPKAAE